MFIIVAKVMIVDDEATIRQSVRLVLESEGYEISEASNADDALIAVQKNAPDLILLDIRMPGMPSVELIKRIKSDKNLSRIKIIYLTAIVGAKQIAQDMKGVEATIEKPFTNEELLSALEQVLKRKI